MSTRWFKFSGKGLARVLGKLEAEIMEAVWQIGAGTIQEVCDALGPGYNPRTVTTVMNRLVEKDLLSRESAGRAFRYRPTQTRESFVRSVSQEVLQGLLQDFSGVGLVPFVDVLEELSPETLEELVRLLRERSSEGEGEDA